MAILDGTTGDDKIIGTDGDDIITSFGGIDWLRGREGADTYVLSVKSNGSTYPQTIIDERLGDSSEDTIIISGLSSLIQTASLGYIGYSTFKITNNDNLIINTPYRPSRFRKPGISESEISIIDQYDGTNPNAQVEFLTVGTTTYNLIVGDTGTAQADIMVGRSTSAIETFYAGDGNDFIYGNGGKDYIYAGGGDDYIFAGKTSDVAYGGAGSDHIFGEIGNDYLYGDDGTDFLYGGEGRDRLIGGNGNDYLYGNEGDDRLWGKDGHDRLEGHAGDDMLMGGRGGDLYIYDIADIGSEIIREQGNAPTGSGSAVGGDDIVFISGYGSGTIAISALGFDISGDDLVISFAGSTNQILVRDHFTGPVYAVEKLSLEGSIFHISDLRGDQFKTEVHDGGDADVDDIIFGTGGDDVLYGGLGFDTLVGGAGADVFLMKNEEIYAGVENIRDFSLLEDIIDFSDIKGLSIDNLLIQNNLGGHAEITNAAGFPSIDVVLSGIDASDVTSSIFLFEGQDFPV